MWPKRKRIQLEYWCKQVARNVSGTENLMTQYKMWKLEKRCVARKENLIWLLGNGYLTVKEKQMAIKCPAKKLMITQTMFQIQTQLNYFCYVVCVHNSALRYKN
jgi:hypothetical protein